MPNPWLSHAKPVVFACHICATSVVTTKVGMLGRVRYSAPYLRPFCPLRQDVPLISGAFLLNTAHQVTEPPMPTHSETRFMPYTATEMYALGLM